MIFRVLGRLKSMSTPTVKEITRHMEPVVHDDFIDDLVHPDPPHTSVKADQESSR